MKRKIALSKNFNNAEFLNLINKCLRSNRELSDLKKQYDEEQNKYGVDFYSGMYHLTIKGQNDRIFFELTKNLNNAEYTINLIFERLNDLRNLYVSYETIGGAIEYERIPPFMRDISRVIAGSEFSKSSLGTANSVIYADEANRDEIISRINNYTDSIPMILASEYFDARAYEIDENALAKNLTCFAYVVVADCNFMRSIKHDIHLQNYNGSVTVLSKDEKPKTYRKEDMYRGVDLSSLIFDDVKKYSSSIILPQLEPIVETKVSPKAQNSSEKELIEQKQRLKRELDEANQKIKNLEKALIQAKDKKHAIIIPNEIYEGESIDLIYSAITEYIQCSDDTQKRIKQLGKEILEHNPRTKTGEIFFSTLKKIFYNGSGLNGADLSKLKELGFQIKRNNVHTTYEIAGLQFTTGASPSDDKSGIRFYSDITKVLRVYKTDK